jgi:hypothetical protein
MQIIQMTLLLLQDNSEQATMKNTALYGKFSEPDTVRHQLEHTQ